MLRKSFAILFLLATLCSCGSNREVNDLLDRADAVIGDQPDSALRLIRAIRPEMISRDKTFARYALSYSQALDKNSIDLATDTLMLPAVEYLLRHGTAHQKAQSLFYLGRIYINASDLEQATERFAQAEVFSRMIEPNDPYLSGLIFSWMGYCYHLQSGFVEALEYYKQAEKHYVEAGVVVNIASAIRSQGLCYHSLNDRVAAVDCFRRALDYYSKAKYSDAGLCYFKEYVAIQDIVQDSILNNHQRIARLKGHIDSQLNSSTLGYGLLSELYESSGELDSALFYMQQVVGQPIVDDNLLIAYRNLSRIERGLGNYKDALNSFEKYVCLKDSLTSVRSLSAARAITQRVDSEELQRDFDMLRVRHRYNTTIGLLASILVVVLLWQLVRLTRIWRRRLAEQQAAYENVRDEMSDRLSAVTNELYAKFQDSQAVVKDEREDRFIQALDKRMGGLRDLLDRAFTYRSKPDALLRDFTAFVAVNPCAKQEVLFDLQYVVNHKFNGVVDYIRNTFPALTPAEIDLCCMMCFGFTPAAIAFVYGYENMGSLYNKRSVLRLKLGFNDTVRLDNYFHVLCRRANSGELYQTHEVCSIAANNDPV